MSTRDDEWVIRLKDGSYLTVEHLTRNPDEALGFDFKADALLRASEFFTPTVCRRSECKSPTT